jgi:streptogramin lyase
MLRRRSLFVPICVLLSVTACDGNSPADATPTPRPNDGGSLVPDHATVVRIDADTGRIRSVLPSGEAPFLLIVASGHVWTQNFEDGTLTHVDPATDTAMTVDVGEVVGIATDGVAVWVARDENIVARLDGTTGEEELTLKLSDQRLFGLRDAGFIAAADGSVWLTVPPRAGRSEELWRIDPESGAVMARIVLGGDANPPFVHGPYLWLVTKADQSLTRVDMRTNEAVEIDVDAYPWSLVAGGGALWIGHHVSPKVVRFDPQSLEFSTKLSFDTNPRGLAFGGGRIWVATEDGLYAVDPQTEEVTRLVEFGAFPPDTGPIGVAFLDGDVWISIE